MCYIISAHKGQSDLEMISDKVQVSAAPTLLNWGSFSSLISVQFSQSMHRVLFDLIYLAFLAPHVRSSLGFSVQRKRIIYS